MPRMDFLFRFDGRTGGGLGPLEGLLLLLGTVLAWWLIPAEPR